MPELNDRDMFRNRRAKYQWVETRQEDTEEDLRGRTGEKKAERKLALGGEERKRNHDRAHLGLTEVVMDKEEKEGTEEKEEGDMLSKLKQIKHCLHF